MSRRVLILSSRVGSGHLVAATALERAFYGIPGVEVCNLDATEHATWIHDLTYSGIYFPMARVAPWLMDWGYQASHIPFATEPLLPLWDRLNTSALARRIRAFDPEITICTHFMPARVVGHLIAAGQIRSSLSVVLTDYDFHGIWLSPIFSRYFVALEETQAHCWALGLPHERVVATGIPVDPSYAEPVDWPALLAKHGLRAGLPIVIVSAGAAGASSARHVVEQLIMVRHMLQAIIICGRNERLRREITTLVAPHADRFRVFGFTEQMPDLLRLATLFIGKPGGLAAAECMAAGLPMLLIDPLPGQEDRNCAHLLEEGAAMRVHELTTIAHKVERILTEPGLLARIRASAARFGRPNAARTIVEHVLTNDLAPIQLGVAEQRRITAVASGRVLVQ
jgi:processive 1,2-diacylglycerol beta-glucosyltransferase